MNDMTTRSTTRDKQYEDDRNEDRVNLAVMKNDIKYIVKKVDDLDVKVSNNYVSKDEFEPIKRIVYGVVGLILMAVVGALVGLVLR